MVTVITDKLSQQSLEDLPNDDKIGVTVSSFVGAKGNRFGDHLTVFGARSSRQSMLGHSRTRSYPQNQPRRSSACRLLTLNDSSVMQRTSMPPVNKKLRRSLSVPEEESAISISPWAPRASSIWQPVRTLTKPRSDSCPDNGYRFAGEAGVNAISTPPASPTPRPASADAALDGPKFFLKEGTVIDDRNAVCRGENRPALAEAADNNRLMLPRSQSQPCFDQARGCGLKRRLDESTSNGNLRPALDLAKMEETSYWRFRYRKKCLRIPKYMNKKTAEGLTPFFTEPEKFSIKPIKPKTSSLCAQVSSIMITPTSSPTKNLEQQEPKTIDKDRESKSNVFCNLSEKSPDEGVFHLDYDSELDLNSIEEDDIF